MFKFKKKFLNVILFSFLGLAVMPCFAAEDQQRRSERKRSEGDDSDSETEAEESSHAKRPRRAEEDSFRTPKERAPNPRASGLTDPFSRLWTEKQGPPPSRILFPQDDLEVLSPVTIPSPSQQQTTFDALQRRLTGASPSRSFNLRRFLLEDSAGFFMSFDELPRELAILPRSPVNFSTDRMLSNFSYESLGGNVIDLARMWLGGVSSVSVNMQSDSFSYATYYQYFKDTSIMHSFNGVENVVSLLANRFASKLQFRSLRGNTINFYPLPFGQPIIIKRLFRGPMLKKKGQRAESSCGVINLEEFILCYDPIFEHLRALLEVRGGTVVQRFENGFHWVKLRNIHVSGIPVSDMLHFIETQPGSFSVEDQMNLCLRLVVESSVKYILFTRQDRRNGITIERKRDELKNYLNTILRGEGSYHDLFGVVMKYFQLQKIMPGIVLAAKNKKDQILLDSVKTVKGQKLSVQNQFVNEFFAQHVNNIGLAAISEILGINLEWFDGNRVQLSDRSLFLYLIKQPDVRVRFYRNLSAAIAHPYSMGNQVFLEAVKESFSSRIK